MRKNEIKRMVEEVVRVEYTAEDGTVFYNEEECKQYEASAMFVVKQKLKRLNKEWTSIYQFNEDGSDEQELEIFDVQTQEDLDNLRRYLYLKLMQKGVSEKTANECFTSVDGKRKDYVFDSVTFGHEVLVFWSYDEDWFWVYNDGSLEGYFIWLRSRYAKILAPKANKEEI